METGEGRKERRGKQLIDILKTAGEKNGTCGCLSSAEDDEREGEKGFKDGEKGRKRC